MEGDYVVERYMKSGDLFYVFAHPSDRKREHYVLRVEAEADAAFYGGETISLKGFIVGQRKTEDWNRTLIDESEENLKAQALELDGVKRNIEGKEIKKIIVVKGRIINIVAI